MMKHFFLITNSYKDDNLTLTKRIQYYIESKGGTCTYYATMEGDKKTDAVPEACIPEKLDCIIVIGGDGTLIRAARDTVKKDVPLIGVNFGTMGYLCELEETTVLSAIDQIMEGKYMIENRMRISGHLFQKGTDVMEQSALNDIVIHRSGPLQVLNLVLYVNGEYLSSFGGDGVIVSTPTGSTGYNISAGGPIVEPRARMIVITPINAHNFNSKSMVFSAEDEITIEVAARRREQDELVHVSFDGDRNVKLGIGDRIVIHQAKRDAKILKISKVSFLEILRDKMNK